MRNLRRIEALEGRAGADYPSRWHQLRVRQGENEADVRLAYEAEHGPIENDGLVIWRMFVKPMSLAAAS